ncbi:unnamed protein product [Schistosoma curassoni]|uniref:RNase H domain-containing protein n=1 Tax=Schistosoma curassoni TaxID=6186 RepID=A0A183KZ25_9TREM|nr:unnamed protein product [Schistosoma curassoni]
MGLPRITRPINTSNVICKAVKHAIEFQMIKLAVWRGCEEKHHIITFCNSQELSIWAEGNSQDHSLERIHRYHSSCGE